MLRYEVLGELRIHALHFCQDVLIDIKILAVTVEKNKDGIEDFSLTVASLTSDGFDVRVRGQA